MLRLYTLYRKNTFLRSSVGAGKVYCHSFTTMGTGYLKISCRKLRHCLFPFRQFRTRFCHAGTIAHGTREPRWGNSALAVLNAYGYVVPALFVTMLPEPSPPWAGIPEAEGRTLWYEACHPLPPLFLGTSISRHIRVRDIWALASLFSFLPTFYQLYYHCSAPVFTILRPWFGQIPQLHGIDGRPGIVFRIWF